MTVSVRAGACEPGAALGSWSEATVGRGGGTRQGCSLKLPKDSGVLPILETVGELVVPVLDSKPPSPCNSW